MSEPKKQNYLHGAAILALGVVIMKILGFIYKVPLGNILGDTGYGYFNTAYNIYNVFLTITTAGFPVALSRMIAGARTLGHTNQVKKTFRVALYTFFALGIIGTLVMLVFSRQLAEAMNGPKSALSIAALSPAVLFCCLTSAYRGYCQGHGNMTPTTVGQVLEVLVKVVVGICLAWVFSSMGKALQVSAAGAIFGTSAGGLAALLYMAYYRRKYYASASLEASDDIPEPGGKIFLNLMKIGIPITLGASVTSLFTLIDNKLVLYQLQYSAGFAEAETEVLWGVYSKAMTLYNLPAAFITPLTISVVPSIASFVAEKNHRAACEVGESGIRIASVICMPMGIGLAVLSNSIMDVIYPGSHESGGSLLLVMGLASVFVCFALITNAVLQAHGNERFPVYSMLVGGIIKVAVNWFLVGNPEINIKGAPVGTLCCYVAMSLMNLIFLHRCMEVKPRFAAILAKPVLSCAVMGAAAFGINSVLCGFLPESWLFTTVAMLVAVAVAVLLYLVLIIKTGAVTAEDFKLLPKGEKLARLLRLK